MSNPNLLKQEKTEKGKRGIHAKHIDNDKPFVYLRRWLTLLSCTSWYAIMYFEVCGYKNSCFFHGFNNTHLTHLISASVANKNYGSWSDWLSCYNLFCWTFDISRTASYETTLVRLSVRRPSLNFFKTGSLVFSDIVHGHSWPWNLKTDYQIFEKERKKLAAWIWAQGG